MGKEGMRIPAKGLWLQHLIRHSQRIAEAAGQVSAIRPRQAPYRATSIRLGFAILISILVAVSSCGGGGGSGRAFDGSALFDGSAITPSGQDASAMEDGGNPGIDGVGAGAGRDGNAVDTRGRLDMSEAADGRRESDGATDSAADTLERLDLAQNTDTPIASSGRDANPGFEAAPLACGGGGEPCCAANTCRDGGCCVRGTCASEGSTCPGVGATCTMSRCGTCGGIGLAVCGSTILDPGFCTAPRTLQIAGLASCVFCGDRGGLCCAGDWCSDPNDACASGACMLRKTP